MVTISLLLSSLDALRYFTTPRLDSYLSCIDGGAFLINDFSLAIVEAARSFFKYRLILGTSIDSHSWTKPCEISSSNEHNCERWGTTMVVIGFAQNPSNLGRSMARFMGVVIYSTAAVLRPTNMLIYHLQLLYVLLSFFFGRSGENHPIDYLETMSIDALSPDQHSETPDKPNIVVVGGSYVGKCLVKSR